MNAGGDARARLMVQRAEMPLRFAMVLVFCVVVVVPLEVGTPSLSLLGGAIGLALGALLRRIDDPEDFRRVAHALCGLALATVAWAVFGLGLPSATTVFFPAIVLVGAANILGVRAALFWSIPTLVLVAAGSTQGYPERDVSPWVRFAVRAGTLATLLAYGVWFRSEHDRQAAELERSATTDPLTGLANRREFDRALEAAIHRARRYHRRTALLYLDLDGLKTINDRFGHDAGDQLIRVVALRIAALTRAVDTAARVGGDEFVLLLQEFEDDKAPEVVARKLLQVVSAPCEIEGESWMPSTSIGVAVLPDDATTGRELVRMADAAMYHAKRAGGSRAFAFRPDAFVELA